MNLAVGVYIANQKHVPCVVGAKIVYSRSLKSDLRLGR